MSFQEFISDIHTFDASNILFSQVKEGRQGSKRIYLNIRDGNRKGPIYIETGPRFCYGVRASTDMNDKEKINGYQMPIPMWDIEGPTSEQIEFLQVFDDIAKRCAQHLVQPEVKKAIKKYSFTEEQFGVPLWYKRKEDGTLDESKGPTLYGKLLTDGPDLDIRTQFSDSAGNPIEPMTLLDKMFKIEKCLLHIQSIFIGTTVKLQVRVVEVEVEQRQRRRAPLMLKKKPEPEPESGSDLEQPEFETEEIPGHADDAPAPAPVFEEPIPEPEPEPEPAPVPARSPAVGLKPKVRRKL